MAASSYDAGFLGGSQDMFPVTPSDTTVYNPPLKNFQFSTDGTLAIVTVAGYANPNAPVIQNFVSGTFATKQPIPGAVVKIMATGTTATGFVGFQ